MTLSKGCNGETIPPLFPNFWGLAGSLRPPWLVGASPWPLPPPIVRRSPCAPVSRFPSPFSSHQSYLSRAHPRDPISKLNDTTLWINYTTIKKKLKDEYSLKKNRNLLDVSIKHLIKFKNKQTKKNPNYICSDPVSEKVTFWYTRG